MSILIAFRLVFFAIIEIHVVSAKSVDDINFKPAGLLLTSYFSEFILEIFFLINLFFIAGE
jgi:hypothetical protein